MNKWESRLPEGVKVQQQDRDGFVLGVSMPVGEDGLSPCQCPEHPEHRFKVVITHGAETSSDMFCPYCGHQAVSNDFLPEQMDVLRAAANAAAEQYIHDTMANIFGKGTRRSSRSSRNGFGIDISIEVKQSPPPSRRTLPSYEIEPTRRAMECQACHDVVAVYGLAIFCPSCGALAPSQQFTELVRVQRDRISALDSLDDAGRQAMDEAGVTQATYESSIKDGFSALETYLKTRFLQEASNVPKPPRGATFQRLDDANELYREHLGVDLAALAGPGVWEVLRKSAAIRHVLTHNAGVIDQPFLDRLRDWPQRLGQRINVGHADATGFLDALESFAASVF